MTKIGKKEITPTFKVMWPFWDNSSALTFVHYLTNFQLTFNLKIVFEGYELGLFFIWGQIKEIKRKKY